MIFSKSKSEIYYLLSYLLKSYDIEILNMIYKFKRNLEDKDNLKWYLSEGKKYDKIKDDLTINHLLFNPYHESYNLLRNNYHKIFHLKILIETFDLRGFILNKTDNNYSLTTLRDHIDTLNYFIKTYGILEIYNKNFQYNCHLTDLSGNRCIRSIIRNISNNNIIYEYKTIALKKDHFINPIDRMPRFIYDS
jgi:hypothetical protein